MELIERPEETLVYPKRMKHSAPYLTWVQDFSQMIAPRRIFMQSLRIQPLTTSLPILARRLLSSELRSSRCTGRCIGKHVQSRTEGGAFPQRGGSYRVR